MERHHNSGHQEQHCFDHRCERLQLENFYLRAQLEQILQDLRPPTASAIYGVEDAGDGDNDSHKFSTFPSSSTKIMQLTKENNFTSSPSFAHLLRNYNCITDEAASSTVTNNSVGIGSSTAAYRTVANRQQLPTQRPEVVGRRLRLLEEELAAFKKDLSNMHHPHQQDQHQKQQRRHLTDESTETACGSGFRGSGRYSDNSCGTVGGGGGGKSDQEIQTSPSEAPSVWPPPAVHGSPRRRPPTVRARELPASIGLSSTKHKRQPPKFELAHWVASRPGCRLARAKYNYKPLRDSPNDNPELELSLEPGDYVLLYGDMDEDYFYHGELFDGEQGLVPSNYVEIIPEEELAVSASQIQPAIRAPLTAPPLRNSMVLSSNSLLEKQNGDSSSRLSRNLFLSNAGGGYGNNPKSFTAANVKDYPQKPNESLLGSSLPDSVCPYPTVDVSSVTVHEFRQPEGARVPCPRELLVERQLAKSVLISWSPPNNPLVPIAHYHVCIDGVVRSVIPGGYKTKALVEDVDCQKMHRISVRAVTDTGQSPDYACSVTIGKDANVAPQDLKISGLTPVSAQVSWYPSNSNCEHLVLLNGLKVGACPPGVSQVQLKGLIPSTMYRCSIRVKDPKAVLEEKPVESYMDFKTLPKIGLPDPPANVQCELGPQDGTILITWQPVTSQPKPPSRAAVAGYLVYADGKKLTEVDSPTGDHVLLRWSDLADDPPLFITVKAKTREGMVSSDSNVVRVPRAMSGGVVGGLGDSFKISAASSAMQPCLAAGTSTVSPVQVITQQLPTIGSGPSTGGLLMIQQSPQVSSGGTAAVVPYAAAYHHQPAPASSMQLAAANPTMLAGTPYAFVTAATPQSQQQQQQQHPYAAAAARQLTNQTPGAPTASYYVFHPHLTQIEPSSMEKPSLLEMENNYLIRHQQRRTRAFANRRSYSLNDEEHLQAPVVLPYGGVSASLHRRQQPSVVPHIHITGASGSEGAPSIIGYSDEDWDYNHGRHPAASMQRPLMARYRRKLRQVDSRALSEPDLRLDPRLANLRQKSRPRYVVALYDYNPRHMSPNPNGAHEELSFRKGQLILVYTEKDADGFYHGELNGRVGLVPSNLVVETDHESQQLLQQQRSEQSPSYSETPDYSLYSATSKRLPQPGVYVGRASGSGGGGAPPDSFYYRRQPYVPSDLERWGNSSDPSLARTRPLDYDYEQMQGGVLPERDPHGRYLPSQQQQQQMDPRQRRSKFKHQSRSLDYDLDRDPADYGGSTMDRDRALYESDKYSPRSAREARSYGQYPVTATMKSSDTMRGRSMDRYDRQQQQYPEYDEYGGQRYRRDYPETESSRDPRLLDRQYRGGGGPPPSSDYYTGSLSRHPNRYRDPRDRDDYDPQQGRDMARHNNQQAFRDSRMRYSEPSYSSNTSRTRDPRMTSSRYDETSSSVPYASEKDREPPTSGYPSRKLPQARDDERDMRRIGRSARDALDQNVGGEHGRNVPPRRLVAQFDYDPKEHSPNPGAEQEELTFRAGDAITVYGDVDEDGFFVGELNGCRGLVPSNFLTTELPSTDAQAHLPMGGSFDAPSDTMGSSRIRSKDMMMAGGVGYTEDGRTLPIMDGRVPVDRHSSRQPDMIPGNKPPGPGPVPQKGPSGGAMPKPQPQTPPVASAGGKPPGPLKKTDSTVGNKTPPKKSGTAQGGAGGAQPSSRKTSVATKPASGGGRA